jgi:hypothetical protein
MTVTRTSTFVVPVTRGLQQGRCLDPAPETDMAEALSAEPPQQLA